MDPPGPRRDPPAGGARGPSWQPPDPTPGPARSRAAGPDDRDGAGGPAGGAGATLRPLNLADILDGAFRLYRANLRAMLAVTALFLVPTQLALSLVMGSVATTGVQFALDQGAADVTASIATLVAVSVALTLLVPLASGGVALVAARSYLGQAVSVREAVTAALRRAGPLLGAWLLVHLVEGLGLLLCVVPGLLAMALLVAVTPVVMVEGAGPVQAMRRSAALLRRRMWPVLGIALLSGLIAAAVSVALTTPAALVSLAVPGGWVVETAWSVAVEVLVTPFTVIVATLVYFDGRVRTEGLDLEAMVAGVVRRSQR